MNNIIEAALKEFERQIVKILMVHGSNSINATNSLPDLTDLISQHFVPKEDHDIILAENRQLKEEHEKCVQAAYQKGYEVGIISALR